MKRIAAVVLAGILLAGCASTLADALASKEIGVSVVVPFDEAEVARRVVAALEGEGSGPVVVEGGIVKAEIDVGGVAAPARVVVWIEPVPPDGVRVTVRAVNASGLAERLLDRIRSDS